MQAGFMSGRGGGGLFFSASDFSSPWVFPQVPIMWRTRETGVPIVNYHYWGGCRTFNTFNAFATWKKKEQMHLLLRTKGRKIGWCEEALSWAPSFLVPATSWVSSWQVDRGPEEGYLVMRTQGHAEIPSPCAAAVYDIILSTSCTFKFLKFIFLVSLQHLPQVIWKASVCVIWKLIWGKREFGKSISL